MDTAAAPMAREDRRLKFVGLALLACATPGFAWLGERTGRPGWWSEGGDGLVAIVVVFIVCANLVSAGLIVLMAGFGRRDLWRDARARRGAAVKLLGTNVLLPAVAFSLLQDDADLGARLDDASIAAPLAALALGFVVWGAGTLRRGWRHEALSADDAMRLNARAPVLYLRSFRDDGQALPAGAGRWDPSRLLGRLLSITSAEQELTYILRRVGPVIAIGKPGEPLPELGAARLYVDHAQWQQTVRQLLQRAALVVVRVGASAGVQWEVENTLATLPRRRIVFVLLGGGPDAAVAARHLRGVLGVEIAVPPRPSGWRAVVAALWSDPRRRLGAVVCFDAQDQPVVEAVRALPRTLGDWAAMLMLRPAAGPLRDAFRRVYAQLGLPWHDAKSRGVAIGLALCAGGLGAHWWYLGRRRRALAYAAGFVLAVPIFLAWRDALAWILMDQRAFDERVLVLP